MSSISRLRHADSVVQVLRRFGRFARIKLDPSPRVADLVLLELKAELIAGSLQVRLRSCPSCKPHVPSPIKKATMHLHKLSCLSCSCA